MEPNLYPAELDEFLNIVVGAKTLDLSRKRFCDFLRHSVVEWHSAAAPEPTRQPGETPAEFAERLSDHRTKEQKREQAVRELGAAAIERRALTSMQSRLDKYRTQGIGEMHWRGLSQAYTAWWKQQLSEKRRLASAQKKPLARGKKRR